LSLEDEEVKQHFLDTHQIDTDGRYIVKLPRISNPSALGSSPNLAMRRCIQNSKSLTRKRKAAEFDTALSEYVQLQHAKNQKSHHLWRTDLHGLRTDERTLG